MTLRTLFPRFIRWTPLLLLAAFLTGCDSSDSGSGGDDLSADGESSFTLSGDLSQATTNAFAAFGTGADYGDEPGVGLILHRQATDRTSWLFLYSEGSNALPTRGTHDVVTFDAVSEDDYTAIYVSRTTTGSIVAFSTSGAFTLTRSESGRMDGSIAFTGTGYETTATAASLAEAKALAEAARPKTLRPISMSAQFKAPRANEAKLTKLIGDLDLSNIPDPDDSGTPSELGESEFTVTAPDDNEFIYGGFAVFGETSDVQDPSQDAWVLALFTETNPQSENGAILLLVMPGTTDRPASGTYAIGNPDSETPAPNTFVTFLIDSGNGLFLAGVEGSVTLSSSTDEDVSGSLTISMVDGINEPAATYAVTGTFDAVSGDLTGISGSGLVAASRNVKR